MDVKDFDPLKKDTINKRQKQESVKTTLNGTGNYTLDKDINEQSNDSKPKNSTTESEQHEGNTIKSCTPPRERTSARIRNLKSKKVVYEEEEWVDPDHIRLSGQKIPVQSNNNSAHEEVIKTVTRKRKRKEEKNFQSMEDYVNGSPLIQVGNLVGLRQCRLCAVMFVEKDQLINHMKAVHHLDDKINISKEGATDVPQSDNKTIDEKPFKCSQCESSFRKSSGLKQHVTRQHSQNAPQKIPPALSNQVSTKKSSTASDRPYACQVCGKAFKRKHHLQEHSYIHSDEKPYKCDTCNKTFNQRICLTKHLPCRELEKQQKKPSCSNTGDSNTGNVVTQQHPDETELFLNEVAKSASNLTANAVLLSSNSSHVESPEGLHHVNGKERDSGTHLVHKNVGTLRENPVSQDTARPLIGHAGNGVHSQEIVKDKKEVIGSSPSMFAESAVTANDRSCLVKEPTHLSQQGT